MKPLRISSSATRILQDWQASEVRKGYFARSKPAKGQSEGEALDTEGRNDTEREAEKEAFQLIMREKERLLSFDEPVSFIFAHSALKEGWDNPNVFQICTLNQTVSEMKKRQEIGRGLRLPVDQNGERILDETVNILTVVANESYEAYAANLQNEYREAGYDKLPPKVTRADNCTAKRNQRVFDDQNFPRVLAATHPQVKIQDPYGYGCFGPGMYYQNSENR